MYCVYFKSKWVEIKWTAIKLLILNKSCKTQKKYQGIHQLCDYSQIFGMKMYTLISIC